MLEAARRAEAEGRTEYALQFYRHIIDHHPITGEAGAAQNALARLGRSSPNGTVAVNGNASPAFNGLNGHRPLPSPPPPMPASPPVLPPAVPATSPFEAPRLEVPATGPAFANPFDGARGPDPSLGQRPSYPPPPVPVAPPVTEHPAPPAEPIELPRSPRSYRTGRVLARVITWLGGITTLAGLVVIPLAILNPRVVGSLPLIGIWMSSAAGLVMTLIGVFQMLIGQLARAVFDQANATRDLAVIARAEAEARYGAPTARSRRR